MPQTAPTYDAAPPISAGNRLVRAVLAATLLATACGEEPSDGKADAAATIDAMHDASGDVSASDADATSVDTLAEDSEIAGDTGPSEGGIDWPCTAATDCESGICLATPNGKRCSILCGDGDCPDGWACQGQTGGGDATYFCVASAGLLCRPCDDDASCQAGGHGSARCVRYGDAGGFCGVACSSDAGCPSGHACRNVTTAAGAKTKQCVVPGATAESFGACGCSPAAKAQGLSTGCIVATGEGPSSKRCKGSRACGDDGLSACEVATGEAASCVETQCLDALTLLPLADGAACDDGRVCTQGDVCKAGLCASGTSICPCEPGFTDCPAPPGAANLCQGTPYCAATPEATTPFSCLPNPGQTVVCDTSLDTTCSKNACVPLSGDCTPTATERTVTLCDLPPAGGSNEPGCRVEVLPPSAPSAPATACDDGLPCSKGDSCAAGQCVTVDASGCGCQSDADCQDDGDLCNGVPFCDKAGAVWACKTNPASVVSCDTKLDGACEQTSCEPQTGSCKKAGKPVGTACDDGVACTAGDICDGTGGCTPGTWTCCKSDVDCAGQEDGDFCNGTLFCNLQSGACELNPKTVVTCPTVDDTACMQRLCQPKTGQCPLLPVQAGKACDDGNACSDGDVCDAKGGCKPGTDICPCKVDADCASKDDGDLCNGTLYCNPVAGPGGTGVCKPNPKTVVTCPSVDDTSCRKNVCAKKTGVCGWVELPAGVTCDADGTACTAGDACDGKGSCAVGEAVCGCQSDADCASKEDGDLCNGTVYCDKSGAVAVCKVNPATVVSCSQDGMVACKANVCLPSTGACTVQPMPAGAGCDDTDACSGPDLCDGKGQCVGGPTQCGCKVDADCAIFDDGDVCNGGQACVAGACKPTPAPECHDGNACTADSCEPKLGCTNAGVPDGAACGTGNGCQNSAACASGVCKDGPPLLWTATDASKSMHRVERALALPEGGVLLVGSRYEGSIERRGVVLRLDADGNAKAPVALSAGTDSGAFYDAALLPGGGQVILCGRGKPQGQDQPWWTWVARLDLASSTIVAQRIEPTAGGDPGRACAVVRGGAGLITVVSDASEDRLQLRDSTGLAPNGNAIGIGGASGPRVRHLLPGAGGVVHLIGEAQVGGNYAVALGKVRIGPDGLTVAGKPPTLAMSSGVSAERPLAATRAADNGDLLIASRAALSAGAQLLQVRRVRQDGALWWHKTIATDTAQIAVDRRAAILPRPEGGALIAASLGATAAFDSGAWVIDRVGVVRGSVTPKQGELRAFAAAAALPDGKVLLAGWQDDGSGNHVALWQRTDAFGRATCAASGLCATAKAGCADGNPCTFDVCADKGCSHVAGLDGAACDDGDACTEAGTCKSGGCTAGPQRLGESTVTANASGTVATAIADAGGAFWLIGANSSGKGAFVARIGADGLADDTGIFEGLPDGSTLSTLVGAVPLAAEATSATDELVVIGTRTAGATTYGFVGRVAHEPGGAFAISHPLAQLEAAEEPRVIARGYAPGQIGVLSEKVVDGKPTNAQLRAYCGWGTTLQHKVALPAASGQLFCRGMQVTDAPRGGYFALYRCTADAAASKDWQTRLAWIDAAGVARTQADVAGLGSRFIARDGGRSFLVDVRETGGSRKVFVSLLDASGHLFGSQEIYGLGGSEGIAGARWLEGAGLLLAAGDGAAIADTSDATNATISLRLVDPFAGAVVASATVPGSYDTRTVHLLPDAAGGVQLVRPGSGNKLASRTRLTARLQDACKGSGACAGSAVGGKTCDDGNACTLDRCDPQKGCVASLINHVLCDDGDDCTADSCDGKAGCNHVAVADATSCGGGEGRCAAGHCAWAAPLLTVGNKHVCVRTRASNGSGDRVACWGGNDKGEVAATPTPGNGVIAPLPIYRQLEHPVTVMAAAHWLTMLGGAKTSFHGQDHYDMGLGSGGKSSTGELWTTTGWGSYEMAAMGETHLCVATAIGVSCEGYDDLGAVTAGLGKGGNAPYPVQGIGKVTSLAAARHATCVVEAGTHNVRCWGQNVGGRLDPVNGKLSEPNQVAKKATIALPQPAKAVAVSYYSACALLTNDEVACWGQNLGLDPSKDGYTGQGSPTILQPTILGKLPGATAISASLYGFCALAGGEVWCWGHNGHGELGRADVVHSGTPLKVPLPAKVVALQGAHSDFAAMFCAVLEDGRVSCWGSGRGLYGGLFGDGATAPEGVRLPTVVPESVL
ncbi:MAG: hypothetical protein H6747_04285 [Deltaproteobacteria bacterium]|nr:hypothetical protein [Deltaproteobacteria bacterium]